jgi:5-(carboxyamino)imidazole ribonucleotide synthase
MTVVGVIGGGQLARMMVPAAINLGFDLKVLAEAPDSSASIATTQVGDFRNYDELVAFANAVDVVTFDHEHVPLSHLEQLEALGTVVRPPSRALALTHDKIFMRQALAKIGVPQPLWSVVSSGDNRDEALEAVGGFPCVAKVPVGGYDGKGVRVIAAWAEIEDWLAAGPVLLEEKVDFVRELAQLSARRVAGQWVAWPPVETIQTGGVCSEVLAPAPGMTEDIARQAADIAETIAHQMGVVGVLAVELFETRDSRVLVNELAMRPHNSGHVFTELSLTSQFEQHLRAVADYPLGATRLKETHGAMVNVFGQVDQGAARRAAHEYPEAKIHSYRKGPRPGRKAGHVVMTGPDLQNARASAHAVVRILDEADYDE